MRALIDLLVTIATVVFVVVMFMLRVFDSEAYRALFKSHPILVNGSFIAFFLWVVLDRWRDEEREGSNWMPILIIIFLVMNMFGFTP